MTPVMMGCGHAANAVNDKGEHSCVICVGIHPGAEIVVKAPDLTKRKAKCSCGKIVKSDVKLAFFEYLGEGSQASINICKHCHYHYTAHTGKSNNPYICKNFESQGALEFDNYYCGCRGWD